MSLIRRKSFYESVAISSQTAIGGEIGCENPKGAALGTCLVC